MHPFCCQVSFNFCRGAFYQWQIFHFCLFDHWEFGRNKTQNLRHEKDLDFRQLPLGYMGRGRDWEKRRLFINVLVTCRHYYVEYWSTMTHHGPPFWEIHPKTGSEYFECLCSRLCWIILTGIVIIFCQLWHTHTYIYIILYYIYNSTAGGARIASRQPPPQSQQLCLRKLQGGRQRHQQGGGRRKTRRGWGRQEEKEGKRREEKRKEEKEEKEQTLRKAKKTNNNDQDSKINDKDQQQRTRSENLREPQEVIMLLVGWIRTQQPNTLRLETPPLTAVTTLAGEMKVESFSLEHRAVVACCGWNGHRWALDIRSSGAKA